VKHASTVLTLVFAVFYCSCVLLIGNNENLFFSHRLIFSVVFAFLLFIGLCFGRLANLNPAKRLHFNSFEIILLCYFIFTITSGLISHTHANLERLLQQGLLLNLFLLLRFFGLVLYKEKIQIAFLIILVILLVTVFPLPPRFDFLYKSGRIPLLGNWGYFANYIALLIIFTIPFWRKFHIITCCAIVEVL